MTSRRMIAAAASLLLCGFVVGGSCASVALADPDSDHGGSSNGGNSSGGNSNGGRSDGHSRPGFGFGIGRRPGVPSGGSSAEPPKTIGSQSPADFGVHLPTRPGPVIGNGRTGLLPRIGGPAPSGSGAPPAASLPPTAGEQSTGPSATPPVVTAMPSPTGIAATPTRIPPAVPQAGEDGGATAPRGWWPTPKLPQVGPGGDGKNAVGLPTATPLAQPPFATPLAELPFATPLAELPGAVLSAVGRVADHVAGLATAAAALPFASISLPVVVAPVGAGGPTDRGGRGVAGSSAPPGAPPKASVDATPPITGKVGTPDPPQAKDSKTFAAGGGGLVSEAAFRVGYDDYLRAAGVGKVAAVAVPGVSGILLLTGAGGLIGYRQARAGSTVRTSGPGRFMS